MPSRTTPSKINKDLHFTSRERDKSFSRPFFPISIYFNGTSIISGFFHIVIHILWITG
jgi:hypothetical protein